MKAYKHVCSFVFITILSLYSAFSQTNKLDTLNFVAAKNNIHNAYINAIYNDLHVFDGKEYFDSDKYYLKGHQFYKSGEEQESDLEYEGFLFKNIPLLYDVYLDQIVLSEPNGSLQFKLENQKIKYFTIHDHLFIRINADTLVSTPIRTGFYDLLVDGSTQVLAKRMKRIFEDATPRGMEGEFVTEDKFFIRKDNRYYAVGKKNSLWKIFDSRKKELQKYSRSHRLKFKKDTREASLIKVVQYYNSLPIM